MFTGIVQARCKIVSFARNNFGGRLTLDVANWTPPGGYAPQLGDSICVSGVCLTIAEIASDRGRLSFDVIVETLDKTTLGDLRQGSVVNIEPAVLATQPMGGHFMQGHVDGVGTVKQVVASSEEYRIWITPPRALMPYVVPKGSIAIDGVSLTLADVTAEAFCVALIPTTLALTTLEQRKAGDRVNLEADIVAKAVVNYLEKFAGQRGHDGLTMDKLRDAGML